MELNVDELHDERENLEIDHGERGDESDELCNLSDDEEMFNSTVISISNRRVDLH